MKIHNHSIKELGELKVYPNDPDSVQIVYGDSSAFVNTELALECLKSLIVQIEGVAFLQRKGVVKM